jgi:hypothetical protein
MVVEKERPRRRWGGGDGIGGVLGSGGAPKAGLDHGLQLQAAACQRKRKWPRSMAGANPSRAEWGPRPPLKFGKSF